jgi:hypothetical protein
MTRVALSERYDITVDGDDLGHVVTTAGDLIRERHRQGHDLQGASLKIENPDFHVMTLTFTHFLDEDGS